MRNWNSRAALLLFFLGWVFTVPMRNWNAADSLGRCAAGTVFTVPMRNWNKDYQHIKWVMYHSFYSTYEELKRQGCKDKNILYKQVFTVPMRNWNQYATSICLPFVVSFYSTYEELKLLHVTFLAFWLSTFLQYLWGIETYYRPYNYI